MLSQEQLRRGAPYFLVVALCILLLIRTESQSEITNDRITHIESPCLRFGPHSKACHVAFGAAVKSVTDYQLCELLSQDPQLTGVKPSDCRRIAAEAIAKIKATKGHLAGHHSSPGSVRPPQTTAQAPASSGPGLGVGLPNSPASHGQSPGHANPPPSSPGGSSPTPPTGSPSVPPPTPTAGPPTASPGPVAPAPSPAPSAPSPVVGVQAPIVPVEACVGRLVCVNH